MAIKEITKAFALFIGYEMPDSSGSTGTILDSMGDSMDGFGSSVDDANSALDDTAKKAEKAAKITSRLGFDEFNTASKPSDSNSGSGSTGGGGGAGSIDPRLLDAMKNIDYMFGNVRMKAMDIRDAILGWMDAFDKVLNENIFEPIANSWNKYGASIVTNAKKAFGDIGHIISSALDVVGEKWQPFFQAASDLFFSLLDTSSIVFSGITKFLKTVWDSGGKYLFEGIFDLGTAFLNLATKINDKFVKPLIRWFKEYIVPVIGSAVGAIMGIIGKLLSALGGIIDWIASCDTAVILLSSALTGMFLAIKVAKFVELFTVLKNALGTFGALNSILLQHSSIYSDLWKVFYNGKQRSKELWDSLKNVNDIMRNSSSWKNFTDIVSKLGTSFKNGITHIFEWVRNLLLGKTATETTAISTATLGTAQEVAAGKTGLLTTALQFLTNNPLVLLAVAIGIVVTAIAGFSQSQKDATYDMEDYSESVQNQIKKVEDLKKTLDDAKKSSDDRMVSSQAEISTLENNIKVLERMGGESGYVENIASAQALVDLINQKLPETAKLTEDGRLVWLKMPDAIEESIEALKEKARIEAYSELYTESIKAQITAQRDLAGAIEDIATKEAERVEIQKKIEDTKASMEKDIDNASVYKERISDLNDELEEVDADLDGLKKTQDGYNDTLKKSNDAVDVYGKSLSNSKSLLLETSDAVARLTDTQRIELDELGADLSGTKKQYEDYTNKVIDLDEQQVLSAITSKDKVIAQYAAKAVGFGKSYDDMIKILELQGITLSDEEKLQLQASIDLMKEKNDAKLVEYTLAKNRVLEELKKHNVNMTSEEQAQYDLLLQKLYDNNMTVDATKSAQYESMLTAMRDNGIALGSEQATQYAQGVALLEKHGYDMSDKENLQHVARLIKAAVNGEAEGEKFIEMLKSGTASNDLDPELETIMGDAKKVVEGDPLTVGIDIENIEGKIETIADFLKSDAVRNKLKTVVGIVLDVKNGTASAKGYATGGFPNIGQMFIAREAGPEFVGSLGGRTAVANNYQIEAGVARGVAQGMSASGGGSSQPQIVESHVTVELDGEVVAKAVDKSKAKKGWNFGMG